MARQKTTSHGFHGLARFLCDNSGTVLPLAAFGMLMLVGVAALAVDAGHMYLINGKLQSAADASALAGVRALPNAGEVRAAALDVASKNLPATNHGAALADSDVVVGRWDPVGRVFTGGAGPTNAVRVTVRRSTANGNPVPTFFAGIWGIGDVDVAVEAIAANIRDPICLLALEQTEKEAVMVNSGSDITADDCAIQVNSSSSQALRTNSGSTVSAETTCVHGDYTGSGYLPTPDSGCPPVADPLAGLAPPPGAGAPCDYDDTVVDGGIHDLYPGVYCGKLEIKGGSTVTFLPGIYIIRNANFIVDNGADAAGAGVSFYLTGKDSYLKFNSGGTVRFSAPTVGPLAGIVVYQDRGVEDGTKHEVNSDSASYFEGVVYLPNGKLMVNSDSTLNGDARYTILIAREFEVNSDSTILLNSDYAGSSVPLPQGLGRVVGLTR